MSTSARRPAGLACLPLDQTTPRVSSNETLIKAGWQRRYLADKPRAEEARAMYTELGYEVKLEHPSLDQFDDDCDSCASTACTMYVLIYTRRPDRG